MVAVRAPLLLLLFPLVLPLWLLAQDATRVEYACPAADVERF